MKGINPHSPTLINPKQNEYKENKPRYIILKQLKQKDRSTYLNSNKRERERYF